MGAKDKTMTTTATRLHLGYEINTGEPVSIPLHHLAVTGLTRLAGKTTAPPADILDNTYAHLVAALNRPPEAT